MSLTSFTSKQLRFTLILNPLNSIAVFPQSGTNTLVVSNCRASVSVQTVPLVPTTASVKVYGMLQPDMNALTAVFFNIRQRYVPNNLIIEQNSGAGWTQVFSGQITDAQPRYRAMPNVFFEIVAMTGYQWQVVPIPPLSYRGAVPVATIAQQIAANMGYSLDNTGGVTANAPPNTYLPGTNTDQLNRLCQMTRTQYTIATSLDSTGKETGTVYIYPNGKFAPSIPMVQLSPQSGLDGYPELEKYGLVITSVFNPTIVAGGRVQVIGSEIPAANGIWSPFMVDHTLEPNLPGGRWHSVSQCQPVQS